MKWFKEEEKKPPYRTKVLMWFECTSCRDGIVHPHPRVTKSYPNHGPLLGAYYDVDPVLVQAMYAQEAVEEVEALSKPHWHPQKPKYWAFISTPYEEKEGNLPPMFQDNKYAGSLL